MKFNKLRKTSSILLCFLMTSAFAEVKEGGNTILNNYGEVVSSKIECIEKKSLPVFVKQNELNKYYKLKSTYEGLTFTRFTDSLSVCTINGGSKKISTILGVNDVDAQKLERVAGWLPSTNRKQGVVLVSNKFLNDIKDNKNNRTKNSLSEALFREVLHSMLDNQMSWNQRDIAVSTVMDETLSQSKVDLIEKSKDEFKSYNKILYSQGFPSAYALDFNNNKILFFSGDNKHQRSVQAFVNYIDIFAADLKPSDQTNNIILYSIYNCLLGSVVEKFNCLPYVEKFVRSLKAENQSYYITYNSGSKRTINIMSSIVSLFSSIYSDKNNILTATSPYNRQDSINYSDLSESILYLGSNKDTLYISEDLILVGLVSNPLIESKTSILGLIPFVQSKHVSLNTKFHCNKFETNKVSIYDIYSLIYNNPLSEQPIYAKAHFKQMNTIIAVLQNEMNDYFDESNKTVDVRQFEKTLRMLNTCYMFGRM